MAFTQFYGIWDQDQATAFSPDNISNLVCWIEADYEVLDSGGLACTDGENVETWSNRANASYDAAQTTTGNQPTFSASGGPNNKNAVYFAGVDEWMDFGNNAAPFIPQTGNFHIFFGGGFPDNGNAYWGSQRTNSTSGGIYWLFRRLGGGVRHRTAFDSDGTVSTNSVQTDESGSASTDDLHYELDRSSNTFSFEVWDSSTTSDDSDTITESRNIEQCGMIIGAYNTNASTYNGTPTGYAEMYLQYLLIYQQEVTGTDLTNLRTYLQKWNRP